MTADYKSSVFLPRTDFPMKANLPARETALLARWQSIGLYQRARDQAKGAPRFVLHDGPPYANGNIHIGTALNKILKDIIMRSRRMLGFDAPYVPGWDCHGLPIEWKVEERYRAAGKNKDEVPIVEFRRECREFAAHWIDVQKAEFRRLGVEGDWATPYTTMSFPAEAMIVAECLKFLMNGSLYRGSKPVMWSVVERTALAEAEVEYHTFVSDQVWVKFPIKGFAAQSKRPPSTLSADVERDSLNQLGDASVVIWTTTPWTIPGNRAICFSSRIAYGLYEVTDAPTGNWTKPGDKLVIADDLAGAVMKQAKATAHRRILGVPHDALERLSCAHPLNSLGYDFDVPLLDGPHVTADTGTGFVHTAPGHGRDDFEIWTTQSQRLAARGIDTAIPFTVDDDGFLTNHAPGFAGKSVITAKGEKGDANEAVIQALIKAGALVARGRLEHEYPHSWRSKKPVIFRNTPQWFIAMDREIGAQGDTLRARALGAIGSTRWVPSKGQTRITDMVANRPDWVISRQRAWGVPIALFVDKRTGQPLRDEKVNARIVEAFRQDGADAWFQGQPQRFLTPEHDPANFDAVTDILDVWFDSGSTHAFVLEGPNGLGAPADLYLEGSDQHRGWFQSSLLESCGTRGVAPYKAVLTHGFVVDEGGRKMSKSLGNVVAPQTIVDTYGADILRLWVLASDYSEDLRIGPEIVKAQVDAYRRLRNTLRYLLGSLAEFNETERLPVAEMPELERYILHRLAELDKIVRDAASDFEFHRLYVALYTFCTVDLSAFYFDIRKDSLYCDAAASARRRAARTVFDQIFSCLTAWLAPIICFTAEEAWTSRYPDETGSVHLRRLPEVTADWINPELAAKWERIRRLRRVVTGALELERAQKRIGASLQAHPKLFAPAADLALLAGIDFSEICITSAIDLSDQPPPPDAFQLPDTPGVAVTPGLAAGSKCERCWQVLQEVGKAEPKDLCRRCAGAIAGAGAK
jgi:isoleucyl-tRNA synthetase